MPHSRQLKWLIAVRMVAITSGVLPYVLTLPTGNGDRPRFLFTLVGVTYVLTLVHIALLRLLQRRPDVQAFLQLLGDVVVITGLVYYFYGDASSPFSLLYLVVIAVAASLLPSRGHMVLANLSWVLYATLVLGLTYGWIEPALGTTPQPTFLAYNLIVHFLGFNAVAGLVAYVAGNVARIQSALEQKQEEVEELESFHRDITNSLSSGLLTTDLDGLVVSINPAGEQILGRSPETVLGRPVYEIGVCHHGEWSRVTQTSRLEGRQREESTQTRGEEQVFIGYSVTPLHDADGGQRGYIVIFQDVTPWRQLEQQVRMNVRMAAIGELSAGIAHELRNPLAAISGSVQLLSSTLESTDSRRRLFDIILSESRRLDRTIEGFLKFSRPPEKSVARFDVAALLGEHVELLRNSDQVTEEHRVDAELDPPSAYLSADRDQISQIFWNLARNALSAMPRGGRLVVSGETDGETYRIRFRDEGRGMTEGELSTMFDPFRTTFHGGTGLGMAIVYRLVQEHGGQLRVESRPGQGTTVSVELPIDERALRPAPVEA